MNGIRYINSIEIPSWKDEVWVNFKDRSDSKPCMKTYHLEQNHNRIQNNCCWPSYISEYGFRSISLRFPFLSLLNMHRFRDRQRNYLTVVCVWDLFKWRYYKLALFRFTKNGTDLRRTREKFVSWSAKRNGNLPCVTPFHRNGKTFSFLWVYKLICNRFSIK